MTPLATLFIDALPLSDTARLLTFLPLCVLVAAGYRATKVRDLRDLPLSAGLYFLVMVAGMALIGFAMWGLLALVSAGS